MADRPRFGPAGVPPGFKALKATLMDVPRLLREEGLDAFEYQAVRWGAKPQIRREDAEKFSFKAKENDVLLSLHASYFINFCGDMETIEASKARLVACATAAHWMQAQTVVFHPGFYGKKPPKEAFAGCLAALKDVVENLKTLGIRNVKLGPETMGKPSQLGSLEEVLALCENVEQTQPVIDWAHLHAREKGLFKTVEDFRRVVETIEKRLGTEAVKNMHCHFTKVEFTDKGEKCHHTLDEAGYGPDFALLAKVIAEFQLNPVVISESPVLDVDAIKMRDILRKELVK
ncbi:MAG: TIM barrel protein [Candidatus Bathyarchaeia archaeon]